MIFVEIVTTSDASRITIMKKKRMYRFQLKGLPWRILYAKGGGTKISYNRVQREKGW